MPTTPITDPVSGESLLGTEPQLSQQVDPGWRYRLNLFTGRTLTDTALDGEQLYRSGLLTTMGQYVTPGTVTGLALTMDTSGPDPVLMVSPGYGIAANGADVTLRGALKTTLSTLTVIDISGNDAFTFRQFVGDPTNNVYVGILLLQPVIAPVSGQLIDTGTLPIEVSGNLGASCDQDPEEYAFEDWQIADAVRLVFLPWPTGADALELPDQTPQATWRNRLAYTIFEAESLLGPDDQLPWAMLGLPVALIGFDPGLAWKANSQFNLGDFITDGNGNIQQVQTAGTSAATQPTQWSTKFGATTTDGSITWINAGLAWKPLFVDRSAVVRAGGLPRTRYIFPVQEPPSLQWQPSGSYAVDDFIVDPNNNIQQVKTGGKTGAIPPAWKTTFGQTTSDNQVTWINNGPASWQPNMAFADGQFIFDSNGNVESVQTAGTSGNNEPDWNGVYLPTSDGTVTWINNGSERPPIIQPALAQARVNQLSEQLSETMAQNLPFTTLADIFPTLPPSGILPATSLDFTNRRATWFPLNWSVSAAPVHLEELETVLETGMTEALIAAETSAPEDPTLLEPVEVLVPLPDAVYDPNILVTESVAPVFQQEVDQATEARNLTLQQRKAIQQELNALFIALGPNAPANPNLVVPDDGLTPDEIQGRNAPPPYVPGTTEQFGTVLQSTWQASTNYSIPATPPPANPTFVIDSNGSVQVTQTAGTSGTSAVDWNTTIGETTSDGSVTWLNNGPLAWQASTLYVAGQFIIDPNGFMQVVKTGGSSAAAPPPNWNANPGQTTSDGIIWAAAGNAQWQPDYVYALGQAIFDSNGNIQIVQTGGISGDSAPTWSKNPAQTTQDSGVSWMNLGGSSWQANTNYSSGQAIVDSQKNIQLVQGGGTSGAAQPTWNEGANATTVDAAIIWLNCGSLTWQANNTYSAGQIILDANGNLQLVQTASKSGTTEPAWSTTPGATTANDGSVTWLYLPFNSVDLADVKNALANPPYVITYNDSSTGQSTTIPLISADDLADLNNNGLPHFIARLNTKISQANDLLDTGFLTAQTDIYRFRQNVLGATAASSLATSTILANIATGETASATAENLQNYINTVIPPAGSTTPPPTYTPPILSPLPHPPLGLNIGTFRAATLARPQSVRARSVSTLAAVRTVSPAGAAASRINFPISGISGITTVGGGLANAPISGTTVVTPGLGGVSGISGLAGVSGPINTVSVGPGISGILRSPAGTATLSPTLAGIIATPIQITSPAQILNPGQNAPATSSDITNQSPISGAELNIRTLTIAERLQQSPSQEAMFYAINNRLGFLQQLSTLLTVLEITTDDLPILADVAPASGTPSGGSGSPPPVGLAVHTFSEWQDVNKQPALMASIQSPVFPNDAPEATLFSVGVRVVEQHTMMLRALEARVQQYADFVNLCTTALNNIQNNVQQAQTLLIQIQNNLAQDRQNVAFTTSLLNDEITRVNNVNAQRQQVLADSVQLVAYTRARTLNAIDTAPSRQLVPANVASPVPACLQQTVSIPPELREIVGLLREAPVNWLPSISSQVENLERPVLLQQLAVATQARAISQLQLPLLPSSAAGEPGVYAPAISTVYSSNQQVFRSLQTQRAAIQPAALSALSWSSQVASLQNVAAVNDLISSESVHTEVSNATSRLIQQICSVSTCLYTRASIALPLYRLSWAEYLSGDGASVQLQSLAVLPDWNDQAYLDRQQMQMLVDWLFQQIDTTNSAAMGFMSDVVRTAILLASDVPVDNIIPGNIIIRTQPIIGGVVSLNLPSDRIAAGMYVQLYSGANLAARAVVSDIDSSTVSATVTDVFTPGVYLETSDTAHFTAQTPQALALRPLMMQS
ncbi:MAG TPA: hypothetical protein VLW06_09055 [Terriglobales bacterium]|nr:hypothetical protein [Terriglobales bacterium]